MGQMVNAAILIQIWLWVSCQSVVCSQVGGANSTQREEYLTGLVPDYAFWTSLGESQCKMDMEFALDEARNLNLWALKMFDATAKLPSGVMSGNLNQFGDFDECLSVRGRHKDRVIRGKYCLVNAAVNIIRGNERLKTIDDLVHSHRLLTNKLHDQGHRIPLMETFKWGICIPSSCSETDIETALGRHLQQMSHGGSIRFEVSVSDEVCYVDETKDFSVIKFLVVCLFTGIFAMALLDLFLDVNKFRHPTLVKVLNCFSVRKNWQSLVRTTASANDIDCIHGARFLNAVALLLSHKQIAMLYTPTVNRTAMGEALSKFWTMIGRSAILYTDSFIMFSGILAAYSLVKDLDNKKKINFKEKLFNRFVRFTPNLLGIILFCTYLMGDMGSGPHWGLVVNKYANLCKKNMWRNFFYIHNYFGFDNMCLTHTHQLGIDMQLFVVSPLFIYILWKSPKIGATVLAVGSAASTWLRYEVTQRENLSTLIHYGMSVERLWRTANLSYILPTHRLTVYLGGVLLGYYLRRNGKSLKLTRGTAVAGWTIALGLGLFAMFGAHRSAYMGYSYNPVDSALYNAFAPILWVMFIAWSILACVNGCGGLFNDFLCWKYFRIFTRLSYAVYLTQFPVFFYGIGSERTAQFYRGFHSLLDLPEICIILAASVVLTLMFDIPFQELKKTFLPRSNADKNDSVVQVRPQPEETYSENSQSHTVRKRVESHGT